MNPLVSVIMPAYNSEKYIEQAILSVLGQTYTDWELLIVDDASTDTTKQIIQKYETIDPRIKATYSSKNSKKPSRAKNLALENARGEYIAFLDSDDLWMETKLAKQISLLTSDKYVLCYTGGIYITQDNDVIKNFTPKYPCGNIFKYLLLRYEINNQSVLLHKNVMQKFDETLTIGEDYNLFMKIALDHNICSIKKPLVQYRVHKSSITKNKHHDLSKGVLATLKELNEKYKISHKHPFFYIVSLTNALRHKLIYKVRK